MEPIDARGRAGLAEGVLVELIAALRRTDVGGTLTIILDDRAIIGEELATWSDLTGNAIVGRERHPEGGERLSVRKGRAPSALEGPAGGRRLWIYTNFDCNLACDYCCVRSSPTAPRRAFTAERGEALAKEARALGFREIIVTGGEPFLSPDLERIVLASAAELPTTILTNAMLFQGSRKALLERLPRDRVTLQVSLDSPTPTVHDAHRGQGSWKRARQGITLARALGFRVRIAATLETPEQHSEMDAFLEGEGIPAADRVLRPLARRGNAQAGVPLARAEVVPELTATATGWYWHPVGATDDDFFVAPPDVPLRTAWERLERTVTTDRSFSTRTAQLFRCA